jgi:hypothetical protein
MAPSAPSFETLPFHLFDRGDIGNVPSVFLDGTGLAGIGMLSDICVPVADTVEAQ